MPRWDDPRGRHDAERGRWRRDLMRERGGPPGRERRSFGDDNPDRFEVRGEDLWRHDRHAGPYDQDRIAYRRRYEDAGSAGYDRPGRSREDETSAVHGGEPYAYAGQEYGQEGFHADGAPNWGAGLDGERRANFDFDDPGVGQSQAGYGSSAQTQVDPEFDPDYLHWRDAQLRAHDRDYQNWRDEQQRQYDEQYRQFRSERQRNFGRAFHEWRSQRGEPPAGGQEGEDR
ncbi:hypothetical protein LJR219_001514 [Phenylobacterium sp. LjRoot219]|uniref:hypothetical protein n=1 Tax=Phenylobacterium sp. LjRoot219 TaxID=3342283 RepID=UPI003ECF2148